MYKNKLFTGAVLVSLLLVCGCSDASKNQQDTSLGDISKSTLKNDFAMGIESFDCVKAKDSLKKMKILDPQNTNPLKYYVDQTYTKTASMKYEELDEILNTCINGDVTDSLQAKMAMASQAALDESLDELKNNALENTE